MIFFEDTPSCIHNSMVECPENSRDCKKCGWNPEVSQKRLQTFAQAHPEFAEQLIQMGKIPSEESEPCL